MAGDKHHNLNILLLKDEYDSAEKAKKEDPRIRPYTLMDDGHEIGILLVRSSVPRTPPWSTFLEDLFDPENLGLNTRVSAVIIRKSTASFGE